LELQMIYVIAIIAVVILLVMLVRMRSLRDVHICARKGRVDRLREIAAADPALLGTLNNDGETPLHEAAKYGQLDVLRFLVEHKADVNARQYDGATPLHFAAGFGELETVKFLLDNGAEVDVKEVSGMTPIMAAQTRNHREIIDVLTKAGADPDALFARYERSDAQVVAPTTDDKSKKDP
jgi:ankyrin repeat protein